MTATKQHSIRVSDADWAVLVESAAEQGTTATELLLRGYLRPSFSLAVGVLSRAVVTEEDRTAVLDLVDQPGAKRLLASDLRALAAGLSALAARWPR